MNNVYFSNEGMTSTSANFYANVAKELQNAALERINNVKFFKTSVAVIGSSDKQLMSDGTKQLANITDDLEYIASLNSFCAWVREAIKEKDAQSYTVNRTTIEEWSEKQGIKLPEVPRHPDIPRTILEQTVIDSWDINKRNKYLRLEAFAATYGKYIHVDGAYSKARKKAHSALNNPITKEGEGRDMVLYYTEPSIDINEVDALFLQLQDEYRGYEKELNQMKAELKEKVNLLNMEAQNNYSIQLDEYNKLTRTYNSEYSSLRANYLNWRTAETERISKLKIAVPESLKVIFHHIQKAADSSKK